MLKKIIIFILLFTQVSCHQINSVNSINNRNESINKKGLSATDIENVLAWEISAKAVEQNFRRIYMPIFDINKTMSADDKIQFVNRVYMPIETKIKKIGITVVNRELADKALSRAEYKETGMNKCESIKKIGMLTSSDGGVSINIYNDYKKYVITYSIVNNETCHTYNSKEFIVFKK